MTKPLGIDLFCGLGGWTEGLMEEGYEVVGFDIEQHAYGEHRYPAQLVIQDVLTLHGRQFKDAALIVGSSPCQEFSYRAMPWKRAKALGPPELGMRLFNAQFRIQAEASEAAGRHIPLVVENVRGAQAWVGRSRWNFGSFHLWGDVPALMPMTMKRGVKVAGLNWSGSDKPGYVGRAFNDEATKNMGGSWFNVAHNTTSGKGRNPDGRNDPRDDIKVQAHINQRNSHRSTAHVTNPAEHVKIGGDGFFTNGNEWMVGRGGPRSSKRKAASAMIAKIPLALSRHIARAWWPR